MSDRLTNRYFYTDPLAAAWMAKRYGMKLVQYATEEHAAEYGCPVGEEWDWMECCPPDCGGETINMVGEALAFFGDCGGRIYVHPDSLQLLEPQTGDMITNLGMIGWRVSHTDDDRVYCLDDRGMTVNARKGEMRIIQRNGVPFMWPQRSEYTEAK